MEGGGVASRGPTFLTLIRESVNKDEAADITAAASVVSLALLYRFSD
jgi:hypothetical protein